MTDPRQPSLRSSLLIGLIVVSFGCLKHEADGADATGGSSATGGAGGSGAPPASGGSGGSSATGTGGSGTSGDAGSGSGPGGSTPVGTGGSTAGRTGTGGTGAGGGATGIGGSAAGRTGTGGTGTGGTGTGGSSNSGSALMGDVAFSTPSQSFQGTLTVGMSTAISGGEIRYTTDGTLPTASSTLYAGTPLMIAATTQLRAQPFASGAAVGLVSTAIYFARTFTLTSSLPIVLLNDYGKGASTNKNTYIELGVMIYEPVNGTASLNNLPTVVTRAAFHVRGQSSAMFPQKSYKVEFRDNMDNDAKYEVAGMPADSDWDLIAPYYDRSLLRNPFTYALARDMGRFAPRTAFAEAYVTTGKAAMASADYQGIYWLTETLKINGHRVDLKKLDAADTAAPNVTGGYILEFNWLATDAAKPQVTCAKPAGAPTSYTCFTYCEVTDPSPLPTPTQQLAYITQDVQNFHNTLFTTPIGDYAQYADVGSFVDYLIVNEFTRNIDAYRRSSYYYKDRNGLLGGGPFWDYNFALGIGDLTGITPTPSMAPAGTGTGMGGFTAPRANDPSWQYEDNATTQYGNVNSWFPRLMTDTKFVSQVKTKWSSLRAGVLSQAAMEQRLTTLAAQLPSDAVARDAAKWPLSSVYGTQTGMTGTTPWVKGGSGVPIYGPPAATWQGQVQALHDWVIARGTWIDSQWK